MGFFEEDKEEEEQKKVDPIADAADYQDSVLKRSAILKGIDQMFGGSGRNEVADAYAKSAADKVKAAPGQRVDAPYANTMRSLLKSKLLKSGEQEAAKHIDGMTQDELEQAYKASGGGKDTTALKKFIPQRVEIREPGKAARNVFMGYDQETNTFKPAEIEGMPGVEAMAGYKMDKAKNAKGEEFQYSGAGGDINPQKIIPTGLPQEPKGKPTQYNASQVFDSLAPKVRQEVITLQKDYYNDPVVKKQRDKMASAYGVKQLAEAAESGQKINKKLFETLMARLGGEVGNLAAHDKEGFGGEAGWKATLDRVKELQFWTGEMRPEDIQFIKVVADKLEQGAKRYMVGPQAKTLTLMKQRMGAGYTPEHARSLLITDPQEDLKSMLAAEGVSADDEKFADLTTKPGDMAGPKEVRRKTKDGRVAIFDANTKEFLRWED